MRFSLPLARRRAVIAALTLAGLFLAAAHGRAAAPIEKRLPDSTLAFAKIQNAAAFSAGLSQSQLGQFLDDPALKAWKDDFVAHWDESGKKIKEVLGVNERELFALIEGPAAIALLVSEEFDPSLLIAADAGKNTAAMNDVLSRLTARVEREGDKVSTESFHGVTIHIMQPPVEGNAGDKDKKKAKDKDGDEEEEDKGPGWSQMIVWCGQGSVFWLGTDLAAIKDVIAHEEGRDDALAASAPYTEAVKTLGADASALWYVDLHRVIALASKGLEDYKETGAERAKRARQIQTLLQQSGLAGLGAVVGSFVPCAGTVDSLTKTTILLQGPAQGLLKAFRAPSVPLQPEPWVPASVASYQSFSWDLDEAFSILSTLANENAPGLLAAIEKQLVSPEDGRALNFKQDIFDPLGDRITIISSFKKPITENSDPVHATITANTSKAGFAFCGGEDSGLLIAVTLEDARTFQNTLSTLFALTGAHPRTREFRGTTIYDFELPEISVPEDPDSGKKPTHLPMLKGQVSVAIARDTLFLSREPTLLEKVLRGGGPTLAESDAYRAFAREMPDRLSSVTYIRPDEQARIAYALFKNGWIETGLHGLSFSLGDGFSLEALADMKKFPGFSVFTRHTAQGGRFTEALEDRLTITTFSLRKAN